MRRGILRCTVVALSMTPRKNFYFRNQFSNIFTQAISGYKTSQNISLLQITAMLCMFMKKTIKHHRKHLLEIT